ncbi:HHR075Cp [Eremothecium sinecaudum]|uniref:HHR075Cp n=1 Tax=Eremothecium sinecaudum TaxID=45286 RepID=A0A0X8HWK7_9SACH|nr:HHR075Cp [Eremothecium sinecaudum]AMD22844.1 HHR075Cp [Eremothecium sinecaudum]
MLLAFCYNIGPVMSRLLLLITLVTTLVVCEPYEAFPVSTQFPAVARVGQPFSWQLSNDTFKSKNGISQIIYETFDRPDWLFWDSEKRILSGTVGPEFLDGEDVKYFTFTLQGTDESDQQTLVKSYQLVATRNPGPQLNSTFDLLQVLRTHGPTNGKDALKLASGDKFDLSFDKNIFVAETDAAQPKAFYGRSTLYHAPLPSWLRFDESGLKFSGVAPAVNSDIAPELDYSFTLIASDLEGFAGVELKFELSVGAHQLTTKLLNTLAIDVAEDGSFSYPVPFENVYLDSNPIQDSDIRLVQLENAPSWVKYDDHKLMGKIPDESTEASFSISIYDQYSNVVYMDFSVKAKQEIFATSLIPDVNATRGSWFEYYLSPSQFKNRQETKVLAEYSDATWLSFQDANMTFHGMVPQNFTNIVVQLRAERNGIQQSLNFNIKGVNGPDETQVSIVQSPPTTVPKPETKTSNIGHTIAIACSITIPAVLILLFVLLMLLRRSKAKDKRNAGDVEKDRKPISSPKLGNPANHPNPFLDTYPESLPSNEKAVNPFSDEANSIESAKKMAMLDAMYLEVNSSGSSLNYEKTEYGNGGVAPVPQSGSDSTTTTVMVTPGSSQLDSASGLGDQQKSTMYYNDEPSKRKSWRCPSHMSKQNNGLQKNLSGPRDSYMSLQTVTTADLLNTEIESTNVLVHDPNKSTLPSRDSVFVTAQNRQYRQLPSSPITRTPLIEVHDSKNYNTDTDICDLRISSSSGGSDFIPVKEGDTYQFTPKESHDGFSGRPSNTGKRNTKRLVNLVNRGGVDVNNVDSIGQEPERD